METESLNEQKEDPDIRQCPYKKIKLDECEAAGDGNEGNATSGTAKSGDNEGNLQKAASEFGVLDEIGEGESENGKKFV